MDAHAEEQNGNVPVAAGQQSGEWTSADYAGNDAPTQSWSTPPGASSADNTITQPIDTGRHVQQPTDGRSQ